MKKHISIFTLLLSLCAPAANMYVTVSGYRIGETGKIQSNLLDPSIVRVSPSGIGTVSELGAPVTFTATPGSGYAVVGWQGFGSNPLTSQEKPATIAKAEGGDKECRSVDVVFEEGLTWLYLVPVLKDLSGGVPDSMWVTPIGYRLGLAGEITNFTASVVAVSPDSTSIARKGHPLTLTATTARDYHVVCWQKFANVDPRSMPETPGVTFAEGSAEVSIIPEAGADQLFVAVVVKYDPVRTVKVGLSSFGKGEVTVDPEKETYLKGDAVTLTAKPAEGYSFVRWSDGNADHTRTLTVDEDLDLKAYIEPKSSRVTFSPGEGAVVDVTDKRVSFDGTYGELPVPVRTGAKFSGWMDDENRPVTEKTAVNRVADHTLYAFWGDILYEIAWDFTGRGNGKVDGAGTYAYGSQPTLKAVPYEGSMFVGWTDGEARNPRRIVVLSNALYVATFDVATYDVKFTYRDAAGNLVTVGPTSVEHGGKIDPPTIPEWPEHTFTNWSTEEYKKVLRDLSVEAIYDTVTYSVAFTYRDWQGNCVTTMPQHVTAGGKANPPSQDVVNNWAGHTFKGWQPDYNVIREDSLCEAIYEVNAYTVTFSYCDAKGEELQHIEYVRHGEKVPFDYAEGVKNLWTGHRFAHWSYGGRMIEDIDNFIATGNMQISAAYEGYARITYAANGGEGEMSMQIYTNYVGDVQLASNAFERTGYLFIGWSMDGSNNPVYDDGGTVTVSDGMALALTACWTPITYTLKFDGNGGTCTVGSVPMTYDELPREIVVQGFGATMAHTTRNGYDLIGWSRKPDPSAADEVLAIVTNSQPKAIVLNINSNLTATADDVVTLYAIWQGKPQIVTINGGDPFPLEYGSQLQQPPDPVKTGYAFVGRWYTNNNVFVEFPITVTGGFDLKSEDEWTPIEYAVSFHGTDGTYETDGTMADQPFTYDVEQALTSNGFTRMGYTFDNWTNKVGETFADGARVKNLATNDGAVVDLYARWTMIPNYYTVKFNSNGGAGDAYTQTIECGVATALTPNRFARTGYGFAGWAAAESSGSTVAYTNGQVVTDIAAEGETNDLYAAWAPNRYWVKFEPNGGEGEMAAQAFIYDVAQALTSNAFTRTGHSFAGWAAAESSGSTVVYADGAVVSNLTAEADATNALFAAWTKKSYEIRFDPAGGSAVGAQTNEYGSVLTAPANPTKAGWTFVEWRLNGEKFDFGSATMPAEDITLVAFWAENGRYTVRFNGNGGTNALGQATYEQLFTNDVAQALTSNEFTRTGHAFAGWAAAESSGSTVVYADGATVTNLTTEPLVDLFAVWTVHTHDVTWPEGTVKDVAYGTLLTHDDPTPPAGYQFAGWEMNGEPVDLPVAMPDFDVTFKPTWASNRYWVAFDANGGEGEMAAQAFIYDVAQALTSNAFTRTGHSFAGWAAAESSGSTVVYADGAVVSNLTAEADATNTLFAAWTVLSYEIRFDPAGGSAVAPVTNEYGKTVSAPTPTKKGHQFDGWYEGEVKFDFSSMPARNVRLTAHWTANTYTVRFNPGEGSGEMGDQDFTYDVPQNLTANAFTAPDWKVFDRWTNAVDSTAYTNCETVCNLATGGVFVLYATWKDAPSYAVAFDGNGATSGAMATNRFECGKGGTLPANKFSRTGYAFDQWTNKVNGATFADGATFTKDLAPTNGTATLNALWTPNRYWIAFEPNGGAGEMAAQAFIYDVAQALTSNEFTRTGHSFAGWAAAESSGSTVVYADGAVVSNLTAEADATNALFAAWTKKSYEIRFDPAGGSAVAPVTNEYGKTVSAPAEPTRTGYQFAGWYRGEVKYEFGQPMPAENFVLTADWTANGYKVRFNPGEGSGEMGDQDFTYDVPQNLTANAFTAPDWKVFDCWTNAIDSTTYANGEAVSNLTAEASGVFDLYARWKEVPSYAVAFDGNGATSGSMATNRFECGKGGTLPANKFSRTGYAFGQWTNETATGMSPPLLDDGATFTDDLAPTNGTATLSAVWAPNRYWIAFEPNGGEGEMAVQAFIYDVAQPLTSNAFTRTGYGFAGWVTNATATGMSPPLLGDGEVVSNLTAEADATNALWATWTANKYMVVYHGPDGKTSDQGFTYDKAQNLMGAETFDPPESWMVFAGWTNAMGNVYAAGTSVSNLTDVADGTFDLYAKWADDSYTVTFDGNGETGGEMEPQVFNHGEKKALKTNEFTRTGYTFKEWTNDAGTVYANKAVFTAPKTGSGETLHAVWDINRHTVTWADELPMPNMAYGTPLTHADPTPEAGYQFAGWKMNGEPVKLPVAMPDFDVVFEPTWEPISYWVKFEPNGATSGTMQNQAFIYDIAQALTSNAFTRTGYGFAGWAVAKGSGSKVVYTDGEVVSNLTTTANATNSLWAAWTPNTYTVRYNSNGGTGEMPAQDFTYDQAQALKGNNFTAPETLMKFAGWATNATGSAVYVAGAVVSNLTAEANGTVDLYAVWADDSYTVTFDGNGETGGEMEPQIFKHGETKALEANAFTRTGHTFANWTNDAGTVFADKASFPAPTTGSEATLHAVWNKETYTDSFDGLPANFEYGATVTQTDPAKTGYTFKGWTTNGIDVIDLNPATSTFVQPDHAVAFTSMWDPITYTIAFDGNGKTGGTMSSVEGVKYGVAVKLPPNSFTKGGCEFLGWARSADATKKDYDDGAAVSNLTAEADATVTLHAVWGEAGNPLSVALGVPGGWDTKSTPAGAWTVIGGPGEGLRCDASESWEDTVLEIPFPEAGTIFLKFERHGGADPDCDPDVCFDGDKMEIKDLAKLPSLGIPKEGTLRFHYAPDQGYWTLKITSWTPDSAK